MSIRLGACMAVLAGALLLSGCGSFQVNPPLARYDPSSGYRFEKLEPGSNSDKLFVILVFSGGGTRAAALSYGVLEALRDTQIQWENRRISLLDEVDVISSISGGSFPAAYYALYGLRIFDEFPNRFLYRSIQSELIDSTLTPAGLLKLGGASFGRSDLAAEFYDREVFGAGTYAEVIARARRPFVILNATDMTTGTQFPFTQDQFDLLCSDLSGISLGRAAAASSAYPGGLTPLTFQSYAGKCGYRQPEWVDLAVRDHKSRINIRRAARAENRLSYTATEYSPRKYIHLTDGGVADNIGLREPLTAINSLNNSWSVLRLINQKKVDKLVVIVVNAGTNPTTRRDQTPEVPGLVDTLTAAAVVPLGNYSFDTLELLRQTVNEFNESMRLVSGCKELAVSKGPRCELDISVPHQIEFFPIEVAFEYIEAAAERNWFKNLPTTLELPRETVDKLRKVGQQILNEDPEFKRLMEALHGCTALAGQRC
ncbi:patatin-like phospholipase family protein [Nitrosospira multiformis]|nr:patatin-like phospholipase family protein [Nitrosospira multiformis]